MDVYLVFAAGVGEGGVPQYWAVPASQVREVLQKPSVYPIPRVPPFIVGSLWYRGQVLTVVDMAQVLGGQRWQSGGNLLYYVLVLEGVRMPVALWVGPWVQAVRESEMTPVETGHVAIPLMGRATQWAGGRVVFHLDVPAFLNWLDQSVVAFSRTLADYR
ncbi:MAG: chemotaxis protein CheW [Acidobacteria bacterium]|nr:chemotaxis protein CheW [Acidobacteriota bacterium]MDW7983658.1 chemotaxis protein CheW [Acidobacteriota bacterium]